MELFSLYLKLLIGFIFITSSFSKWRGFQEHIGVISDYRILPSKYSVIVARIDLILETLIACLLITGVWIDKVSIMAITLIGIYTLAIIINLFRGRYEISCGCGGVVGNHKLSWKLVIRNMIIILGLMIVYKFSGLIGSVEAWLQRETEISFNFSFWIIFFISFSSILFISISNELIQIKNYITHLLLVSSERKKSNEPI